MASESADQITSPGAMLRQAREASGIGEREAAERLNWMPSYVGLVEADDYGALRQPAFARGYVRAYGRLLGLDEPALLAAFDAQAGNATPAPANRAGRVVPATPGRVSGVAIALCLAVLALFVVGLWWWSELAAPGQAQAASTAWRHTQLTPAGEV